MISSLHYIFQNIKEKHLLLLAYFATFLESLSPILAALFQRDLINCVFRDGQYQEFPKLLILYAIFFFSPKLWFTVRKVLFFHISYQLQDTLTKAFLKKIYDMPTIKFHKEHVGNLLNHIRNNIADASDLSVNSILSDAVKNLLTIIFLVVSIAYINILMLFVVLVVAIVYYILLHKYGEKTKLLEQKVRDERAKVSITIEESISSVRETVAYNRQEWQLAQYDRRFMNYYKAILKQGFFKNKIMFLSDPFLYGTKLISILFGGIGVITNKLSIGDFVVSFTLVDQLVTEMGQLFEQSLTGKRMDASIQCIRSIMNGESTKFGELEFNTDITSIQFKDVTFQYSSDSDLVLNHISIDFPIGKKIAIVGSSGSGKSTIAQMLIRMYEPNGGDISMNNVSIRNYGDKYTDKVAIVFQQPYFLPSTIMENIMIDKTYSKQEIKNICKEMLCHDFIMEFPEKYETQMGERGAALSGGQKQRIALARAMLKNPEVLILDEATSALDSETEFKIQKNIDTIRKGKTTIIIAHRLSTILNADIIYVMDKGNIVSGGTHESLLKESPIYKELYAVYQKNMAS